VSAVQPGTENAGDPPRVLFGRRLRELREAAGLRQVDVGTRAGVSTAYVSELERGGRGPTLDVIYALARALGVPVARLFPDPDGD
jgi:transcriptional regulator with XRE-family HTH domain